jgi:hypothetical protein
MSRPKQDWVNVSALHEQLATAQKEANDARAEARANRIAAKERAQEVGRLKQALDLRDFRITSLEKRLCSDLPVGFIHQIVVDTITYTCLSTNNKTPKEWLKLVGVITCEEVYTKKKG